LAKLAEHATREAPPEIACFSSQTSPRRGRGMMKSWNCQFVFYGDDREDALRERIVAALEAEDSDSTR
jgi:hypothetical protein